MRAVYIMRLTEGMPTPRKYMVGCVPGAAPFLFRGASAHMSLVAHGSRPTEHKLQCNQAMGMQHHHEHPDSLRRRDPG